MSERRHFSELLDRSVAPWMSSPLVCATVC
jgi:hypothetical protein